MKKMTALFLPLCMMLGCACASASSFDELLDIARSTAEPTASPTPAAESTATPGASFDSLRGLIRETEAPAATAEPESAAQSASGFDSLRGLIRETEAPAAAGSALIDSRIVLECQDGITVTNANLIAVTDDYSNYLDVYVFAEIRNDGTSDLTLEGTIQLLDADGNVVEKRSYMMSNPQTIAPGASAFLEENLLVSKDDAPTADDIAAAKLTLNADPHGPYHATAAPLPCDASFGVGVDEYGSACQLTTIRIENSGKMELVNPRVAVGLYDAQGKLLSVCTAQTGGNGTLRIPTGSTVILDIPVQYAIEDWMAANDISVTDIKCLLYMQ